MIINYEILKTIHDGKYYSIIRARKNNQTVVIKTNKSGLSNSIIIYNLQNEFELLKKINSPYVIKAFKLEEQPAHTLLVLEDFPYPGLSEYTESGNQLSLEDKLHIGISLAQALADIHQAKIIHKDIKPHNILISPDFQMLKLIDFGIASEFTKGAMAEVEILEGTLDYISPEQTGRMNRAIDYRTDIYSFGVTMYQLLTQQLPFHGNNVASILYQHITSKPVPLFELEPSIPTPVSNIIMKCLSKNAEDRYQTAQSLKEDLENCYNQLLNTGYVEDFPLAVKDYSEAFVIPQKIYNRKEEKKDLLQAFNNVLKGGIECFYIDGSEGIGKSSLIKEIEHHFYSHKVFYVYLKGDPYKQNFPLMGIKKLVQALAKQIEVHENVNEMLPRIDEHLKPIKKQLLEVIPELGELFPEKSKIEKTIAFEDNINDILIGFLDVLLAVNPPLVIIIDDVQWLDQPSLQLLCTFLNAVSTNSLMLILSGRNDSAGSAFVKNALSEIKNDKTIVNFITLKPLEIEDLKDLIHDTIKITEDEAIQLSQVLFSKTQGHPFFTKKYLQEMYDQGFVKSFHSVNQWVIDFPSILNLEVPTSLLDFFKIKLKSLKDKNLRMLKIASVIGPQFDLDLLSKLSEEPSLQVIDVLKDPINEGLIRHMTQIEDEELEEESGLFTFEPIQIREFIYEQMPLEQRKQLHFKYGHILLSEFAINPNQVILPIAEHFSEAESYFSTPEEHKLACTIFYEAGKKTKESAAFKEAFNYFRQALNHLKHSGDTQEQQFTIDLYREIVLCLLLIVDNKKTQEFYNEIDENKKGLKDPLEIGKLIALQIPLLYLLGEPAKGLQIGMEGLKLLGYDEDLSSHSWMIKFITCILRYSIRNPLSFIERKKDEHSSTAKEILGHMCFAAFDIGNQSVMINAILLLNKLTLDHGVGDWGTFAINGLSILARELSLPKLSLRMILLAKKLQSEAPDQKFASPEFFVYYTFPSKATGLPQDIAKDLIDYHYQGFRSGNVLAMQGSYITALALKFFSGIPLENIIKESETALAEFIKYNLVNQIFHAYCLRDLALKLKGTPIDSLSELMSYKYIEAFEIFKKEPLIYQLWFLEYQFLQLYLAKGPVDQLADLTRKIESHPCYKNDDLITENFTFFKALYLCSQCESHESESLKTEIKKIAKMFDSKGKISPFHLVKAFILKGELYRLSKNYKKALQAYDAAMSISNEDNYNLDKAIIFQLMAKSYQGLNKEYFKNMCLHEAYRIFVFWGATAISEKMLIENPELAAYVAEESATFQTSLATFSKNELPVNQQIDVQAIVESYQRLSQEISFSNLIKSLIEIVIVYAGADTAFLITPYENDFALQACKLPGQEITILSNLNLQAMHDQLCLPIVYQVARSRTPLVLNEALREGPFRNDTYLSERKPQSILCIPLLHQSKLKGLLYLENHMAKGAFTENTIKVLNLLSTQMAISLENANFYSTLENKVEERTQSLNYANEELKRTLSIVKSMQSQLIEQEKMATLGTIASGMAHEIKNPLNFIVNFSGVIPEIIKEFIDDNKEKLSSEELEKLNEIIEYSDKIISNSKRLDNLINIMTSHYEQFTSSVPEQFHINQILNEALDIKVNRGDIDIEKSFNEQNPKIEGYQRNLLRALLSILDNAIYAVLKRMEAGEENYQGKIKIATEANENDMIISIEDNGIGISPEVIPNVFVPFYTSKPTGEGVGLGLSIAYDIITKGHGGKINIESELGKFTRVTIRIPIHQPAIQKSIS